MEMIPFEVEIHTSEITVYLCHSLNNVVGVDYFSLKNVTFIK